MCFLLNLLTLTQQSSSWSQSVLLAGVGWEIVQSISLVEEKILKNTHLCLLSMSRSQGISCDSAHFDWLLEFYSNQSQLRPKTGQKIKDVTTLHSVMRVFSIFGKPGRTSHPPWENWVILFCEQHLSSERDSKHCIDVSPIISVSYLCACQFSSEYT